MDKLKRLASGIVKAAGLELKGRLPQPLYDLMRQGKSGNSGWRKRCLSCTSA